MIYLVSIAAIIVGLITFYAGRDLPVDERVAFLRHDSKSLLLISFMLIATGVVSLILKISGVLP